MVGNGGKQPDKAEDAHAEKRNHHRNETVARAADDAGKHFNCNICDPPHRKKIQDFYALCKNVAFCGEHVEDVRTGQAENNGAGEGH